MHSLNEVLRFGQNSKHGRDVTCVYEYRVVNVIQNWTRHLFRHLLGQLRMVCFEMLTGSRLYSV